MKQIKVYVYEDDRGMIFQSRKKQDAPHFKLLGETDVNVIHVPEEKPVRREFWITRWEYTGEFKAYNNKPSYHFNHERLIHVSEIYDGEKILSRDDVRRVFINSNGLEDFMSKIFG